MAGTSLEAAERIMGSGHFFSAERVMTALEPFARKASISMPRLPESHVVPYSESTLRAHADGNWLLLWDSGFSLSELFQMFGSDAKSQPCFYYNVWWQIYGRSVGELRTEPSYVLVRVKGMFETLSWSEQEVALSSLGRRYYRTPTSTIASAAFVTYLLNGGERSLDVTYHWGPEAVGNNAHVGTGDFVSTGLGVYVWPDSTRTVRLAVSVARAPDF